MSVTVRAIDLRKLELSSAALMKLIGKSYLVMAAVRMEKGIGSDGAPMKPYSKGYAAFRE